MRLLPFSFFFFFNDTATTEIYTLSLHDALPILCPDRARETDRRTRYDRAGAIVPRDRKSTRLNSSHSQISYAVFCLKKKKTSIESQTFVQVVSGDHHSPHVRYSCSSSSVTVYSL